MSDAVNTLEKTDEKVSVGEYIRQTREEIEKTSFPSSEDVRATTIIVILNVIFFAIFLFLVDQGWVYLFKAIEWVVNRLAGF